MLSNDLSPEERAKQEADRRIEKECLEAVFREDLDSDPVSYTYMSDGEAKDGTFHFSLDGLPDWLSERELLLEVKAKRNIGDPDYSTRYDLEFFTVVQDCLFGLPPETITLADGREFKRLTHYLSSGETECVARDQDNEEALAEQACPYCECQAGEKHGFIYLGDGWCQVVYCRIPPEESEES
jgi:hypothetical protein